MWRLERGLSQREVGAPSNYGQQYVAKVEAGERMASPEFAKGCDELFGTPGMFVRLRERCAQRSGYPDWFEPYISAERRARTILDYSSNLIMGMLQTEAYANAVFRKVNPREDDEQICVRVDGRVRRRKVLEGDDPPLLWVVLDESCLRRMVGSAAVMTEQLAHLIKSAESPDITVQVLPYGSGAPASHMAFVVLKFRADEPDILYLENPVSGQVIDSPGTVADAHVTYDRLRADALSPDVSLDVIRAVMKEWSQ